MSGRYASNLLNNNTLVMEQTRTFMVSDYEIQDVNGNPIATVSTTNSGGSLFFLGAREFSVSDASGLLCVIQDPPDFGLDRFEAFLPDGQPLALIQQQFKLFRTAVWIDVAGGNRLDLQGNILEFDFQVIAADQVIATASRADNSLGKWLMGKHRYVVELDPNMPPNYRLAIVAGLVALNRILEKQRDSD